ncbi:hypothetical protein [Zunongwangia profunda]|uniref:hypothetical protein n=1 Tax=Zunongwangia profunda TaxID=398743 RepID=UPI00248F1444|nr:hypothetical protein [Zunongwangia profunda]|tara:strand:+ start:22033 stop:22497 length:465 start_codon:yes stop_codon:yes gene_type:complete
MKRFFWVVFCFTLVACGGTHKVTQSETNKETFREHTVSYKDTVFTIPAAQTRLIIPKVEFEKVTLKSRNFESKNGNATARLTIDNDAVYVSAECDSIALAAQIKQELLREVSTTSNESSSTEKRGVSRFMLILYIILAAVVGFVAGVIAKTFII